MKTSRLATLLTIALIVILQSSVVFADLWKMHVNPNHADQLLGNNNEIWVYSIKGGLTRWDIETGEQTRFNEGTGIPLNGIHGLVYDDEGRLLVDLHGKILRFEDGAFNLLTEFPSGDEYIGYSDGFILIGDLHNKGVHRFNGDSWEEVPGLSDYNMRFFSADPQGGFWCITTNNETNVIYYNDGVQLSFSKLEVTNLDSKYAYIKHISVDSKGIVWASIRGGAAWFDGKKWSQYYWDKETIKYDVFNSVEDNEGKIWFAASVNGLYRYDDETFTKVPEYEDSKVLWVEKAPRGGVWVGTEESLEHFDGTTRTPYIIPNQLPISNETTAVTFDQEGNLWCGDYYGDLALLHGNEWKLFRGNKITETESGSTGKLNCLLASNINGLWTAFDFDVLNYKDETWTNFMDELEPEIGFGYHDLAEDPSGNIWVSAVNVSSGLARWNGSSWEFHKPKDGVPQNKNVMCFDNEGKLWLVTVGSLYSYDNIEWKQVKIFSDKNFPIKYFNGKSISAFNNGTVWVGGWGGIVVFKDGEIVNSFTSENGLPKLPEGRMIVVQGIKQAPDGTKWINTDNGFVHYDGTQFKTYTEEDAGFYFGGNDFAIDPIGRIFFVSNGGGLTEFTPTSVTMKMSLSTDNISYKRSDNFSLKLSVKNNGPDETGDFYFVMLTPDGTIYSALDWSKSIHPAASNITIPAGFTLPLLDVVSVTLPSSNPPISMPGKYYFAIGLADTGTGYFRSKAITSLDVRE